MLLFPFHIWFSMLQVIMSPVFCWMTYFNTDFQVLNSCPNYWSFSMVTVLYGWFLYQPFKGKLFKDIRFYIVWNSWGFGWKMLTNCCTNLNTNLSPSSLSYFLSTQVQGFFFSCFKSMDFLCLLYQHPKTLILYLRCLLSVSDTYPGSGTHVSNDISSCC